MERVGLLGRVETREGAGRDQRVGELGPLLVGAGAPPDVAGLGELRDLVDPAEDPLVRGRRCSQVLGGLGSHATFPLERSRRRRERVAAPAGTSVTAVSCELSDGLRGGVAGQGWGKGTPNSTGFPSRDGAPRDWIDQPAVDVTSLTILAAWARPQRSPDLHVSACDRPGDAGSEDHLAGARDLPDDLRRATAEPISERVPRRAKVLRLHPALVAQRIEHLTTDQKVGGSNPSERASAEPTQTTSDVGSIAFAGLPVRADRMRKPVVDAPQDRVGAGGDAHLAVGAADVGLHGVDAQERALRNLLVVQALGDQRDHLGLALGQAGLVTRPAAVRARARGCPVRQGLAGTDPLERGHELVPVQGLGQHGVGAVRTCRRHEVGTRADGVEDQVLGLDVRPEGEVGSEGVVERDVGRCTTGCVGNELDDPHAVAEREKHVVHAANDHLVVIHERQGQGHCGHHRSQPRDCSFSVRAVPGDCCIWWVPGRSGAQTSCPQSAADCETPRSARFPQPAVPQGVARRLRRCSSGAPGWLEGKVAMSILVRSGRAPVLLVAGALLATSLVLVTQPAAIRRRDQRSTGGAALDHLLPGARLRVRIGLREQRPADRGGGAERDRHRHGVQPGPAGRPRHRRVRRDRGGEPPRRRLLAGGHSRHPGQRRDPGPDLTGQRRLHAHRQRDGDTARHEDVQRHRGREGERGHVHGRPDPIAQLEARVIARNQEFQVNGRRSLRASSTVGDDGILAYDPGKTTWTATFTGLGGVGPDGLSDADRAVISQSRVLWLGRNPGAGTEATIFEYDEVGGPADPCTAPLRVGTLRAGHDRRDGHRRLEHRQHHAQLPAHVPGRRGPAERDEREALRGRRRARHHQRCAGRHVLGQPGHRDHRRPAPGHGVRDRTGRARDHGAGVPRASRSTPAPPRRRA